MLRRWGLEAEGEWGRSEPECIEGCGAIIPSGTGKNSPGSSVFFYLAIFPFRFGNKIQKKKEEGKLKGAWGI